MSESVIEVLNLHKAYGHIVAVKDISFSVAAGSIFGLVGPNGAGKTTTVECIEGLRMPDRGAVQVLGKDPVRNRQRLYRHVGVQLQENSLHRRQKVIEAFRVFASLYERHESISDLIRKCGLEGRENDYYGQLSGGQKRRLLLGLALLGNPKLLILDEPTSGLDPQARYNIWKLLTEYQSRGMTILLTTHYMDEAQDNCDMLCIIDHGQVIALGSPKSLLEQHQLEVCVKIPAHPSMDLSALQSIPSTSRVELVDAYVLVYGLGKDYVSNVSQVMQRYGLSLNEIETRRAKIEDLYLILTGREYRKE